jgi:DNA ligase D-like protein (predicted 3'-phosphoesterase)
VSLQPQARRITLEPPESESEGLATLRDATVSRARELELLGWASVDGTSRLAVHVEGAPAAVDALIGWLTECAAQAPATERAEVQGHEQFAARGISAGVFVVQEHQATAHHFDLRLQVGEVMRSWAVPKGPSLDPAVKRLAVEVEDHSLAHNEVEGSFDYGQVLMWDRGTYEQGGRVAWPAALERGHAVFVLHGAKLSGGFALQRTRAATKPQWLLLKRRDEAARPGSDIVAEQPHSVLSGRVLAQLSAPG